MTAAIAEPTEKITAPRASSEPLKQTEPVCKVICVKKGFFKLYDNPPKYSAGEPSCLLSSTGGSKKKNRPLLGDFSFWSHLSESN